MKLHHLIALFAVLAVLGCAPKEEQPPTAPTTANAKPYPGMQGANFRIPERGAAASTPSKAAGGK